MTTMTKTHLNEEIARFLGFEESPPIVVNGVPAKRTQWTYPASYPAPQPSVPNTALPDFILILSDYIRLMAMHGGHGRFDFRMENDL